MEVNIPISIGELVDKITILQIKSENVKDDSKLKNINKEYESLNKILSSLELDENKFTPLYEELYKTNLKLWNIEDEIRLLEKKESFEEKFISTARSVYITNDIRFEIKNKINIIFGSEFIEEKSYKKYK
tara:strand:- start:44 stop:433 length:390 start_codon:yes stop_codon:yes gene_type:complete